MVQNAKEFNATGSRIYEDAERIRKALSNFMPKHNPAYKDERYRAIPTPIPEDTDYVEGYGHPAIPNGTAPPMIKLRMNGSASRKSSTASKEESPAIDIANLQEEQQRIVEELIELRDPELVACVC
jgi:hypothetical protein